MVGQVVRLLRCQFEDLKGIRQCIDPESSTVGDSNRKVGEHGTESVCSW